MQPVLRRRAGASPGAVAGAPARQFAGACMDRRTVLVTGAMLLSAPMLASCRDLQSMPRHAASRVGPAVPARYQYLQPAEVAFVDAAVDAPDPGRHARAGRGRGRRHALHRPPARRALRQGRATGTWQGPLADGHRGAGLPVQLDARRSCTGRRSPRSTRTVATACGASRSPRCRRPSRTRCCMRWKTDKLALPACPARRSSTMLWQNTQEGFFADPLYGGNRDFAGWKLIGFPGPRYNYVGRRSATTAQPYPAADRSADGPRSVAPAGGRCHDDAAAKSTWCWSASAGPRAIMGQELTDAGLDVLALERGKFRQTVPDFATTHVQDELRYAVRHELFERPARETLTFRNSLDQTALPMRHLGSFLPGRRGRRRGRALERPDLALPADRLHGSAATPRSATARSSSRTT